MTDTASTHEPSWDGELPDAPFRLRDMGLGPRAGMRELGATLNELEEGGAVSPYHLHHANEELLVVLSGAPNRARRAARDASSRAPSSASTKAAVPAPAM